MSEKWLGPGGREYEWQELDPDIQKTYRAQYPSLFNEDGTPKEPEKDLGPATKVGLFLLSGVIVLVSVTAGWLLLLWLL